MLKPGKLSLSSIRMGLTGRLLLSAVAGFALAFLSVAANASGEGITVHGKWVVTVTNPDGSLAQERVFQNALTFEGKVMLVSFLAGKAAIPGTGVNYFEPAERAPDVPAWDIIVTASGVADFGGCTWYLRPEAESTPLVEAAISVNPDTTSFTLARTMEIPPDCVTGNAYNITAVGSSVDGFTKTEAGRITFSDKTLASPITGILADQVVTLRVTYSFE